MMVVCISNNACGVQLLTDKAETKNISRCFQAGTTPRKPDAKTTENSPTFTATLDISISEVVRQAALRLYGVTAI